MKQPKDFKGKFYAYFSPDGYIQVRTIGTKKEARMFVTGGYKTWKDYEKTGFYLKRVSVNIKVL